ncbi:MAG: hypothetical protein PVI86_07980 [Phycisphaerae bacterium]|jgi:hypothetical protein
MITKRLSKLALTAIPAAFACLSCVEREEKIRIARDGAVIIELEYEGSEGELATGDAMPAAESGWEVERSVEKKNDDVIVRLESARRFAPGETLPRTFAAAGDPDTDLYCDFPTEVRIERRHDAIYYYFRRTYAPRRWTYIQRWHDEFIDDDVKKLAEKPVAELTPDEQGQMAEAFAGVEAFKQIEFSSIAIAESHPELPVEYGLMARRALIDYYTEAGDSGDLQRVMDLCGSMPDEETRGACFDREADRILGEGYAAYIASLKTGAGFKKRDIAAFEHAYQRAQRYHRITEKLGGHSFQISVTMPGEVIADNTLNGDVDFDEEAQTSTVKFEFDGEWFRDRPCELIAVSRLDYRTLKLLESRADDDDR